MEGDRVDADVTPTSDSASIGNKVVDHSNTDNETGSGDQNKPHSVNADGTSKNSGSGADVIPTASLEAPESSTDASSIVPEQTVPTNETNDSSVGEVAIESSVRLNTHQAEASATDSLCSTPVTQISAKSSDTVITKEQSEIGEELPVTGNLKFESVDVSTVTKSVSEMTVSSPTTVTKSELKPAKSSAADKSRTFKSVEPLIVDRECASEPPDQASHRDYPQPEYIAKANSEPDCVEESREDDDVDESVEDEGQDDVEEEAYYEGDEKDDDEIVGNPAYIPKSGRYYMHDMRDTEDTSHEQPRVRSRADGKWKHDRFDPRTQRPKTRRELLNRYGYDIRSTDGNTQENCSTNKPAVSEAKVQQQQQQQRSRQRRAPPQQQKAQVSSPQESLTFPSRGRGGGSGGRYAASVRSGFVGRGRMNNRAGPPAHRRNISYEDNTVGDTQRNGRPSGNASGRQYAAVSSRGGPRNGPPQRGSNNYANNQSHPRNERRPARGGRSNAYNGPHRGATGAQQQQQHRQPPLRQQHQQQQQPQRGVPSGGKRYSTQRIVTTSTYANGNQSPNVAVPPVEWNTAVPSCPPPPPPPPPIHHPPAIAPTGGPVATIAAPVPPPPQPVANFSCNDTVYFDPQQQQLYRSNPIAPRAKKRLEIVPPSSKSKNSS